MSPVSPSTPAAEKETPANSSTPVPIWDQPIPVIAASLWFCGMILFLLSGIGIYLLLRQRYKTAYLYADPSLFKKSNQLLRHPFRRPIRLYVSPYASSPLVIGIFRPRIILPEGDFPEQQAVCMVLHELIHIRRGDHLIRLLSLLLTCIHWFNPLIWLALKFSAKDMELSCDEAVLSRMGEQSARTYASALLDLSVRQHHPLSPLLMFGESNLKSRVKNALSYKKPTLWVSLAAILILAAGAIFLLTDPIRQPSIQSGDSLQVDLNGVSLTVTADSETASLLQKDGWTETDAVPEMYPAAAVSVTAGEQTIQFSQTDSMAVISEGESVTAYQIPLGTEETLRAKLLESSEEFAALPSAQQELLSSLLNAEQVWGCVDYPLYFPASPEFVPELASLLLTPGEEIDVPEEAQYPNLTLYLIYPQGRFLLGLTSYEGKTLVSDGNQSAVLLDQSVYTEAETLVSQQNIQEFSTQVWQDDALGFTRLEENADFRRNTMQIVGNYLVSWGYESNLLTVYDLQSGEILRQTSRDPLEIFEIRASTQSEYEIEISGTSETQGDFVWSLNAREDGTDEFYTTFNRAGNDIPPERDLTAAYNYSAVYADSNNIEVIAGVSNTSPQRDKSYPLWSTQDLQKLFTDAGRLWSQFAGFYDISFTNGGKTVVANLSMNDYPANNGFLLAVRDGDGWKNRILAGTPDCGAIGNLQASFYKILDDETIACYQLMTNGWSVELIDQNTLETIRILDFGAYSPEYLSLENRFPYSMSGDSFYSPRVVICLLDRSTAAVIDRSYKLRGQRLYLLDLDQKLLSDPIALNGTPGQISSDWLITIAQQPDSETGILSCYPLADLRNTISHSDLRPLIPKQELEWHPADAALMEMANNGTYLMKRGENLGAWSAWLAGEVDAFSTPSAWTSYTPDSVPPAVLPEYTDDNLTYRSERFIAMNLYRLDGRTVMELLPIDPAEEPVYYQTDLAVIDQLDEVIRTKGDLYYSDADYLGRDLSDLIQVNRHDIIDLVCAKYGLQRRYDCYTLSGYARNGDTILFQFSNFSSDYLSRKADEVLIPDQLEPVTLAGRTFYNFKGSWVLAYTIGETPVLQTLEEAFADGSITETTLDEALNLASERYPRLYRDETTFRIEQILNCTTSFNAETGNPMLSYDLMEYYRFQELKQEFQASEEWDSWVQTLDDFLEKTGMAESYGDPEYAQNLFFPGELIREALRDAHGNQAQPELDSGNMTTYYPEEDIVQFADGFGFSFINRLYPVSMTEEGDTLTVQFVDLVVGGDSGGPRPGIWQNTEFVYLGESWRYEPTLQEVRERADELTLETAIFTKEDGRWILSGPTQ
ncbi:MAG: M56 family metallopeptidase [Candidatus Merdivicinus sp.]